MNKLYIFCQNPGLVVQEVRTNMVVAAGELKLEDAVLKNGNDSEHQTLIV